MRAIFSITRKKAAECLLSRLMYPNGKKYEGEFANDKPHGKGVLTHPNGKIVKGVWNNGQMIEA